MPRIALLLNRICQLYNWANVRLHCEQDVSSFDTFDIFQVYTGGYCGALSYQDCTAIKIENRTQLYDILKIVQMCSALQS